MGYFEDLKTQASSDTGALLESASAGLDRSELSHSTDIDSSYYRVDTYTLDTLDVTDVGRAHEEVSYDDDGTRVTRLVLDSGDVVATARETTTETDEGTSVSVSVSFDERYTVYGSLDEYAPHEQDPLSYGLSKNFDSDGKITSMETSGLTVRTFEYSEGGILQTTIERDAVGTLNDTHTMYNVTRTEYDDEGRMTREATVEVDMDRPARDDFVHFTENETTYEYDDSGKIISMTENESRMIVGKEYFHEDTVKEYLGGNESAMELVYKDEKVYAYPVDGGGLGLKSEFLMDATQGSTEKTETEYFENGGVKTKDYEDSATYGTYSSHVEYGEDGSSLKEINESYFDRESSDKMLYDTEGNITYEQHRSSEFVYSPMFEKPVEKISDVFTTYYRDDSGKVLSESSTEKQTEKRPVAGTFTSVIEKDYKDGKLTGSTVKILGPDGKPVYTIERKYDKDEKLESKTTYDNSGKVVSESKETETLEVRDIGECDARPLSFADDSDVFYDGGPVDASVSFDDEGNVKSYEMTAYDRQGNFMYVEKYDGSAVYDRNGERIEDADSKSSEFAGVVTRYDENGVEREREYIDNEDSNHREYYDENGNLEYREIEGEGEVIRDDSSVEADTGSVSVSDDSDIDTYDTDTGTDADDADGFDDDDYDPVD